MTPTSTTTHGALLLVLAAFAGACAFVTSATRVRRSARAVHSPLHEHT
jgi:hypothetical protein